MAEPQRADPPGFPQRASRRFRRAPIPPGMNRRAKIVCTIGPATHTYDTILALVRAGMDVARLNFSHGVAADHAEIYRHVRAASDATGRAVGILVDLQGPKIRLGRFADDEPVRGRYEYSIAG